MQDNNNGNGPENVQLESSQRLQTSSLTHHFTSQGFLSLFNGSEKVTGVITKFDPNTREGQVCVDPECHKQHEINVFVTYSRDIMDSESKPHSKQITQNKSLNQLSDKYFAEGKPELKT